jgi:putative tryptophan/tyrosine transport system substrate-binding protein
MRRIGVLMALAESDPEAQAWITAFREGLQKLGRAEGRNIRIDTRWAALEAEAMQRYATELVALQPDLILSQNTPTTCGKSMVDGLSPFAAIKLVWGGGRPET